MADSGSVAVEIVERVLIDHGWEIRRERTEGTIVTVVSKDDVVLSVVLSDWVRRRMLHFLKRKLDMPICHFYHPEETPDPLGQTVQ